MDNIAILQMNISDLDKIAPILLTEFDDFWSVDVFERELLNPNSKYLVAKKEDEIIGFAGIWKAVDDVHITNIVVKKSFRNKGIGSIILEQLIEISKLEKI